MYCSTGRKTIKKVSSFDGTFELSDGSKWKASIFDKSSLFSWSMFDDVDVASYIGNKFKITHVKRNETITAEQLA